MNFGFAFLSVLVLGFAVSSSEGLNYNLKVVKAEQYKRPLNSGAPQWLLDNIVHHTGVVVTLENGERWLVHKGNEYGQATNTVVVSTSYMSSNWYFVKQCVPNNPKTLQQYVIAGGPNYNMITDNCIYAASRMMALCN